MMPQEGSFYFEDEGAGAVRDGDFYFEDQQPMPSGAQPKEGDFYFEEPPPEPKPWYEKKFDLPQWIDKDKWESAVTSLNDAFAKRGEQVMEIVKDPWIIAEGVTEIAQQTPGFLGGLIGAAGRIASEVTRGNWNLNDLYNSASESFANTQQSIEKYTNVYDPKNPEAAALVGEVAFVPATAVMMAGHEIADSDAVNALPEGVRDQVKGVLKFAGDIGGLVLQGKMTHGATGPLKELAGKDPMAAAKGAVEAPPLDTTFAKDLIRQKIALERASTKQRPLDTLARREAEISAAAAEEARLAPRQADLEAAFSSRPAEAFAPKEYGDKLGKIRQDERINAQVQQDMAKFGRGQVLGDTNVKDITPSKEMQQTLPIQNEPQLKETGRWVEPVMEAAKADAVVDVRAKAKESRSLNEVPQPENARPAEPVVPGEPPKTDAAGQIITDTPGAPLRNGKAAKPAPNGVSNKGIYTDQPLGSFEIPELRTTQDAVAFGEKATPEQISRLQTELENSRAKSTQIREAAKAEADPSKQGEILQQGMDEATRGQFFREALEASEGKHPSQEPMRKLADIARDVNTVLGSKGAIGRDLGGLNPEQRAAYDRLAKDFLAIRRNAKRVGKEIPEYLTSLKVDPKVASALDKNAELLTAHAAAIYGQNILKRYEDAADQPLREGKFAGNSSVNLTKQDLSKSAKQLQQAVAADMPQSKPIPWDETQQVSAKMLTNPNTVESILRHMERRIVGGKLTAETNVVRELNAETFKLFSKTFDEFKEGKISAEEFNGAVANLNEGIFRLTSDVASELGRALNAQKMAVSGNRIAKAVGELGKAPNKRQQAMIDQVVKKIQEGTLTKEELEIFHKYLPDPKMTDYLKQFWYNNVLSGPVTHMKNFMSNTSWLLAQIPMRGISGALDATLHPMSKAKRSRYVNEVLPMIGGYLRGYNRGKIAAGDIFKKGYIENAETKWSIDMGTATSAFERSPNPTLRAIAPAFTMFSRALFAMDVWGRAVAYDGQIASMARRASNKKGLSGAARVKFEQEYRMNPPEEAISSAMKAGAHSTFMDSPDPLTSTVLMARGIPAVGTALQYTMIPFVNTIGNLMKRGIELTPGVGLAKEGLSYAMREGIKKMPEGRVKALGKEWAENRTYNVPDILAKQVMGTMLAFQMLNKASQGRITGPMPEDPAEREFWYRNGITPWSVRVGGTDSPEGIRGVTDGEWHSYRWAEPFNTVIASAALMQDKILRGEGGAANLENYFEFAGGMFQNLIDGAYFAGIQRFMDPYAPKADLLTRPLTGFVPYSSLFRTIARSYEVATEGAVKPREAQTMQGPAGRVVNPFVEAFSQVIPGLSGTLPAKLTVYGEEREIPGGVFDQWVPVRVSETQIDEVEQSLAQVGLYPSLPSKSVSYRGESFEIPLDVYRDYCIDYGADLKEGFKRIVDQNGWSTLPPEKKFDRLKMIRDKTQERARKRLVKYMRDNGMFNDETKAPEKRQFLPNP